MEHTKKFVLVDPRFVKPSMRDKAMSGIDSIISNILDSDESDDIKVKNYISALARYKNYSAPPKIVPTTDPAATPIATPAVAAVPATPIASLALKPMKRPYKRVKVDGLDATPSLDPPLWRRTQRAHKKKKFGSPWIEYNTASKKKSKPRTTWIES